MRMPRVLELLEQYRPHLLALQETKSEPDAFPDLELAAAGYKAVHHSAGRWAGVATVFIVALSWSVKTSNSRYSLVTPPTETPPPGAFVVTEPSIGG